MNTLSGLDSDEAVKAVQAILSKQKGVSAIKVDGEAGQARFELETAGGNAIAALLEDLKAGGYSAHEAKQ